MSKGPILLGGLIAALTLLVTDHPWLGLIAFCVSLYLTNLCRPFRDPVRLFPDEMRRTIWRRAGGLCQMCGVPTHYESDCPIGGCSADFQADHVIPWSRGGRTVLDNGSCLCQRCNAVKSDR